MEKLNELVEQAKEMAVLHGPVWSSALCESGCDGQAIKHHAIISDSKNDFVIDTGSDTNEASWLCDYLELCSPANILAIAEAFRALEQEKTRLESIAMHANRGWKHAYETTKRAEAAEAKLAELEKQEPRYQVQKVPSYGRESLWIDVASREEAETNELHGYRWRMVYEAPAPAINLAELVPDEKTEEQFEMHRWAEKAMDIREVKGWNDCRAAIMRNIEEAK